MLAKPIKPVKRTQATDTSYEEAHHDLVGGAFAYFNGGSHNLRSEGRSVTP